MSINIAGLQSQLNSFLGLNLQKKDIYEKDTCA